VPSGSPSSASFSSSAPTACAGSIGPTGSRNCSFLPAWAGEM
jgi:hypothetical protein